MSERRFPIQGDVLIPRTGGGRRDVLDTTVPWSEAEIAYETYAALGHGDQSLEDLARRGGFGRLEFAILRAGFSFHSDRKLILAHPPVTEPTTNDALRERLDKVHDTMIESLAELREVRRALATEEGE